MIIDEEGEEASVIPAEAAEEEDEEEDGDEEKSFLNFLKGDFDFDLLAGCIDGGGASDDGRGGGWRAVQYKELENKCCRKKEIIKKMHFTFLPGPVFHALVPDQGWV